MSWMNLLRTCLEKGVPFFSYRQPSAKSFVVGVQRTSSVERIPDFKSLDLNEKGFVVAPFLFGEGESAYSLKEDFSVTGDVVSDDLVEFLSQLPTVAKVKADSPKAMTKADYLLRVGRLISSIRRGEAGKAVFSRSIVAQLPEAFDWAATYHEIQDEFPQAFVYCFYIPEEGLWMGATPELLLSKEGTHIETVALAGTMPQSSDCWSPKNSEEQAFVVRYVEQALRSHEVENLKMEGPISVSAGSVCHLKTNFQAELKREADALPLLAALHPTPAVCGYPKRESMCLIAAEETAGRSFYSGFLGAVNGGDFSFFVNLRCMRIYAHEAVLFVGGGIMKDSQPEDEWEETQLKSKTMGRFVGLR